MVHLLSKDFVSEGAPTEFIATLFVFIFCITSFLIFPSVKHFKWKVVYLIKVTHCTVNMTIILSVLWWVEWVCGEVLCLDHHTAYSRTPVPAKLSVHIGINAIHLLYTTDVEKNGVYEYEAIVHYVWSGLSYTHELDKYDRKIKDDMMMAPLPIRWVLEQFLSRSKGPKFGFHLQTPLFISKNILYISLVSMMTGWCHFVAKNKLTGSFYLITAGFLQVITVFAFILQTYCLSRKIIIGYQELYMAYSISLWILAGLGCLNIASGCLLIMVERYWSSFAKLLFYDPQVLFIETRNTYFSEHRPRRLSSDSVTCDAKSKLCKFDMTNSNINQIALSQQNFVSHTANSDICLRQQYLDEISLSSNKHAPSTYISRNKFEDIHIPLSNHSRSEKEICISEDFASQNTLYNVPKNLTNSFSRKQRSISFSGNGLVSNPFILESISVQNPHSGSSDLSLDDIDLSISSETDIVTFDDSGIQSIR